MITVNNFHDLFTLRKGKLCEIANNNNSKHTKIYRENHTNSRVVLSTAIFCFVCSPRINNNEEAKHYVNSKGPMAASHLSMAVFFLSFAYTTNGLETQCSMSFREPQQLPLHWPQAAGLLQSEIAFNRRL